MENKGCTTIPRILFEIITFLTKALPIRSIPTFIELLVGAMITQAGFVTEAWLAINPVQNWSSYYKWLEKGQWSWVTLGLQLAKAVVTFFPQSVWLLIFDDTFIYRSSKKAPCCGIFHQHGNKTNRPVYARGQCWVTMALSITAGTRYSAIALLSRLIRATGNRSKLDTASRLAKVVAPVFANQKVIVLMDSWYMKWPFLSALEEQSFHAIGQVRKDTALYDLPIRTGKRGRPAKYGKKYTADGVAGLPEKQEELFLYGREQMVCYRSVKCLARFMKGRMVRVVWTRFEDKAGNLGKTRVLLSTNFDLSAKQIIEYYAKIWSIEDLFNQMKNKWGWKETWQQSRQVLHRWVQILSVAYALPQLLATYLPNHWQQAKTLTPWRKKQPITAGRVRLIMQMILGNVRVRDWWNPKCRKFEPPIYSDFKDKTRQSYEQQPDKDFKSYQNDGSPPPI